MTRRDGFIASVIFVVIVLVCAFVAPAKDGGGGHKKPAGPMTTSTTQPKGTTSTTVSTTTPSGPSDPITCKELKQVVDKRHDLYVNTVRGNYPVGTAGTEQYKKKKAARKQLYDKAQATYDSGCGDGSTTTSTTVPNGPTAGDPPSSGDPEVCVPGGKVHWFSREDGKIGEGNFGVNPYPGLSSEPQEAGGQLVGLMENDTCVDPSSMTAHLVAAGLVKVKPDDEEGMNSLTRRLLNNPQLWRHYHHALLVHHQDIEVAYVTGAPKGPFLTLEMLSDKSDPKAPVRLRQTQSKSSCDHILVIKYKDGRVEVFCIECRIQPRWEITPQAPPPATPVPQCKTCKPKRPKPPCKRNCGGTPTTTAPHTTTTRPPTPTTTTTTRPPSTTTTAPPVLCLEGPDKGKPAPGGDLSRCRKSDPGSGTPGD